MVVWVELLRNPSVIHAPGSTRERAWDCPLRTTMEGSWSLPGPLQWQWLITKHATDDSTCGVEIDAVPDDKIRRITDDGVDVLLDLDRLVDVVLMQPHAGANDIEDVENTERPIAFMRA